MLVHLVLMSLGAAPSIAVGDLTRVNVTAELATFAAEHVGQTLGARGFKVVTPRDMQAILGLERQKQLLGCADDGTSCAAELAQAIGADLLLTGTIARLGAAVQLDLRLLDARDGSVRARFSGKADDEAHLPELFARAGEELADALSAAPTAATSGLAMPRPTAATWVLLGAGVAVAGAGAVCLILAEQDYTSLLLPVSAGRLTYEEGQATRDRGKALQVAGPIALGVGAAVIAAGVVLWLRAPRSSPVVSGLVTPNGAALLLSGTF
ncbi:MAG: FlgO family outer membrane protein [Myxococcota bacterium]